jgi:phenylalanyl-tRNA synthetase beta chain
MKIPLSWLQEYVKVPVEPARLAHDLAFVGFEVASVESDGRDTVIDFEITTNRVDCMNVYGMAREIAVLYDQPLKPLDLAVDEKGASASSALDVAIEAADLCPRFCARVADVTVGPSPAWLRDRLEQVGVRSISNLVDLTNYVMMEMGQPTHAFDLPKIPGAKLTARFAREGEKVTTLDGVERTLTSRTGVVAGSNGPLALAGIMGGASSEVGESTKVAALEAAYWDPLIVRRGAKALAMHTEASHRFERGTDSEGPVAALARIAHLLQKIGAGSTRPGLIDRVARPMPPRTAVLRPDRLDRVLGATVPPNAARRILTGLGFGLAGEDAALQVAIPTWRGDVSREVDVIEEVARHHGLDKIPTTMPPARRVEGLRSWQVRERALRELLTGCGLSEVINYAFVREPAQLVADGYVVTLQNPLSEDQAVLRRSLVVPGLLANLTTNLRQGRRDVRVFELGRVFFEDRPLPREERRLAFLLHGGMHDAQWAEKRRPADFFDGKGIVEAIAQRLDVSVAFAREGVPAHLHPGQSARIVIDGVATGWVGVLHPDVAQQWELREGGVVAELAIDALLGRVPPARRFSALPRFPVVTRDLSFFADETLEVAAIERTIQGVGGHLLHAVDVADRYQGAGVPSGKVSLTLTLRYQHPARTLTGDEVQRSVDHIVAALAASGIKMRGE